MVGANELAHAIEEHFSIIPQDIVLEILERVLRDPTDIYRDDSGPEQSYSFFYRLEQSHKYIVAVVKSTADGVFFASMYPTGKKIRTKHKNFRKVIL